MQRKFNHTFTKSKMNKDLDERLLPNGEYRDGRNISVNKSEGPDEGVVENIIGNNEGAVKKLLSGILIFKDSNKNQIITKKRNRDEIISMIGAALPAPSSSEIYFLLFKFSSIN